MSSDCDEAAFASYHKEMPCPASSPSRGGVGGILTRGAPEPEGKLITTRGRAALSADPDGKAFSNWGLKPPSQMCSRVRRECGMKTGPAQVMLLNGGGNSRCVACRHLRSFTQSDSMYLSLSPRPCAVGLSLPAPSFPSPLSSSFFPPSSPGPSLPLPSGFSLSSSLSLPSLLPLSLPSPSPRNPDCFSGWGWAAPALPPLSSRYSALAAMRTGVCVALRV